jgi:Ca-activated chloride channel family protein
MNGGFTFDYPVVLCAFAGFIPLFLYDLFSRLKKRKRKLPPELRTRLLVSVIFFRLFAAFFIIALSGPRWGVDRAAGEYRRRLDAVIAVDVSRSMDIRDAPPFAGQSGGISRLERGLAIARESAAAMPGARFAAAVSRGRGLVAVPLTWDNGAVFNFLEFLDGSSFTGRGTNLESLLDCAAGAFQNSFPSRRLILLISDGEALSGNLRAAVERCAGNDIMVSAIAVGSEEGRAVPGEKDAVSRRDSATLRMAAEHTGGLYIDGSRDDAPAVLSAHLRALGPEYETRSGRREKKQRWPLFVLAALLAYAGSKACLLKPRLSPLTLGALVFLFSSCSPGKLLIMEANFRNSRGQYSEAIPVYLKALEYTDAAAYAEYGLGSAYYSLEEGKAALERFTDSQKILESLAPGEHRELRYRIRYNTGIVLFGRGDFPDAAAAFKEALRIDPGRIEAKRNLELSLLSAARERASGGTAEQQPAENGERDALFEYLRRKEQQQWKSREWAVEEEAAGPDY